MLPKAHTRFSMMWRWNGHETVLMSRAVDDTGYVQPTLAELLAVRGQDTWPYHMNPIVAWRVPQDGRVEFRPEVRRLIRRTAALFGCIALGACGQPKPPVYGAGRPATLSEIAAWDIDVNARGAGLPRGSGGAQDGARYYATLCSSCHGARAEGTASAAQLVRPEDDAAPRRRNIATHWPYAPPLLDYIRRAMPPDRTEPLGADTLYAIVAYLLDRNHIALPGSRADSATLFPRADAGTRTVRA